MTPEPGTDLATDQRAGPCLPPRRGRSIARTSSKNFRFIGARSVLATGVTRILASSTTGEGDEIDEIVVTRLSSP